MAEPNDTDDTALDQQADDEGVEEAEQIEDEVEERNPDPITKREAFEREAAEEGLAEEAGQVGDVIDGDDERSAEDDGDR